MPKRLPPAHRCRYCDGQILNIQITKHTKAANYGHWTKFVGPEIAKTVTNTPGLEDFVMSQLATLIYFDQVTHAEITQRASAGCDFYQYIDGCTSDILNRLAHGKHHIEPMDPTKSFQPLLVKPSPAVPPEQEKLFIWIEPQAGTESSTFRFRWIVTPYRPFHLLHFPAPETRKGCHVADDWVDTDPFQLIAHSASNHARHVPRMICHEPGNHRLLDAAKEWLEDMLQKDVEVADPLVERRLPTRLLRVETDSENKVTGLRLIETKPLDSQTPYAALSYCWGGPQEVQLTTSTKTRLEAGLSLSNLPATIKDAAVVTAHLGFSHVWIDALCMIQDDEADMGRELAIMAQIYAHATVTIAASRASSVTEGFLHERLPSKGTAQVCFELDCLEPFDFSKSPPDEIKAAKALIFPVGDIVGYTSPDPRLDAGTSDGIPANPLVLRAWTFQERALSPRLIEFGLYGTRFRALDKATGHEILWSDGWKDLDRTNLQDLPVVLEARLRPKDSALRQWHVTLANYTCLKLSFRTDRLPAMSAFAQFFSTALGGAEGYIAGIWRCTLPFGLLWQTHTGNLDKKLDEIPDQDVYVAPSWSWASQPGQATYWHGLTTEQLCADQDAEVLDAHVELKNPAVRFGAVTHGTTLRMRGRLRPARLALDDASSALRGMFNAYDEPRSKFMRRYTRVEINGDRRWDEERGLHRGDYGAAHETRPDYRLPLLLILDWGDAATKKMIGESSRLAALPVASDVPKAEKVGTEPGMRTVHGLLLLEKSEGVYSRVGTFKWVEYDPDSSQGDMTKSERLAWYREQYAWLGGGQVEEFSII